MKSWWWESIQNFGSVWQHSGDPRAPHVVLRSGKHSDGFVDTLQFLSKVEYLNCAAQTLAVTMEDSGIKGMKIDWVFGSPMAGGPIATAVAPILGAENIGFTEKKGDNLVCRFDLEPEARVVIVEEMTTSGATPRRQMNAILAKNPKARIIPIVGAFLSRCGSNPPELQGAKLVSVVNLPKLGIVFREWEPENCPLCKMGSRAISNCKLVWKDLLLTMADPTHPVG